MLTDEQKWKAQIALLPRVEDLERAHEKEHALELHKQACTGMELYGLPYRVYLDYLKNWDNNGMIYEERLTYVLINPCYPDEGYPLDKVKRVTPDDIDESKLTPHILPFDSIDTLKKQVQNEIIRDVIEPLRKWKILDDNWKRYFSHFLVGYDFESFTEFDFSGTTGKMTPNDLGLLRNIYARVLKEYEDRVLDGYLTEEPRTTKERRKQYTDKPYRVLWDRDTIEERENLTKQLGIEPSYTDEEYDIVFGMDDTEEPNEDTDTPFL